MIIQFTNIVEFVALERAYGYNYHINMYSVHVGTFIFPLFLVMSLCLMNEMCSDIIWFEKLCLYFVCQHILVKFRLHEILKKNKVKLLPKIWKRLKFLLHFINEAKGKLEIVIESHGYWIRVSISCRKCGEPCYDMFGHNSCKREGRLQIQEHFELLVRS